MELGAFSVSLNVKDIATSKAFYESLGFTVFHGNIDQKWLIMKNKTATIGLFQGMIDKNLLTFNPGWDSNAHPLDDFTDIREIQKSIQDQGIPILNTVKEGTSGPGNLTLLDPDGNTILIDQHV